MSNFRAISRIYGVLAPALHKLIAVDIEAMLDEILDGAAGLWASNDYTRFNDDEANCTIQLYRWSDEIVRTTMGLRVITITLEWVQPTPGMIAGLENATGSSRPDLKVAIGRAVHLTIECKRLSLSNDHPRRYVTQGIARFVSGEYARTQQRGVMVGYVQADDPGSIVEKVNGVIVGHPLMGSSHQLKEATALTHVNFVYGSDHQRVEMPAIQLKHYLMDLRGG